MGARQKLNVAYVNGGLLVAAILGVASQSWAVFLASLAVLIGGSVYLGEIRPGGRGRRP